MYNAQLSSLKENESEMFKGSIRNCDPKTYNFRYFKPKMKGYLLIQGQRTRAIMFLSYRQIDNDETMMFLLHGCFAFLMSDYCVSVLMFLAAGGLSSQGQM